MKKVVFRIAAALCVLLAVLSAFPAAAATVNFTTDGAADPVSLYVAGCPDCFPIEYYDADSGTYAGATPAFLALVTERTGLDFVYIRTGEWDRRRTLAKNNQVDLLFATSDEWVLLNLGMEKIRLFSVMKNGEPTDVYCVFTSVSGKEQREAIRAVAEDLTKDDVARLLTENSMQMIRPRLFWIVVIVLGALLLAALIALTVFMVLFFRCKRKKDVFVDAATSIGNKKYFLQMYNTVISDQTRELYYVVHFGFAIERINNNFGVKESDHILRYSADSVNQRVKDNEFCARIGGGSFAAAIYANGPEQAERRVEELLRVLNAYSEKYMDNKVKTLFRAGICVLSIDDKNAEKVLYNAEQAYRRAVEEKKPYVFVNHDVLNESHTKVSIREQASEALEQHAFTPYVQLIVDAKNGEICGGEILSRWETRLYGLLTPGNYIPILQDMGLIVRHDLLMLEEACKLLEQWQSNGKSYFLACNLTRVTISDPSLVESVTAICEKYAFRKEKLILEVTENTLEEDKNNALHNMLNLKERGYRIALDDFTSGYTAVTNLYEYAVDLVKLDRQIILDADRDPHAAALMKEITRLCHGLKIRVLAEGVETETQAKLAHSSRCDYIQGYYYARPLPLRELGGYEETFRSRALPAPEDEPYEETDAVFEEEAFEPSAEAPGRAFAKTSRVRDADGKKKIHIEYGKYRMDLPGDVDMDPVSMLLRAMQEKME